MPLGKISKSQVAKGFEALEQIEDALKNNRTSQLAELSSLFYTLIPHNFGRQRPPTISDSDTLRKKMDMLIVTFCRLFTFAEAKLEAVFNKLTFTLSTFIKTCGKRINKNC